MAKKLRLLLIISTLVFTCFAQSPQFTGFAPVLSTAASGNDLLNPPCRSYGPLVTAHGQLSRLAQT